MMKYHTPHIHFHLTDFELSLLEKLEHYDVFIFAIIIIALLEFFLVKAL